MKNSKNEKKEIVSVSIFPKDHQLLKRKAKKYTDGNASAFIRKAIRAYSEDRKKSIN